MTQTSEHVGSSIDWEAIERSPEFHELITRRRRFVIPCTVFFLTWYMTFIVVCAYAPDFMGESVYQGLTVGYCYALTQFAMVFTLGLLYLRKADRDFDPLAERAIAAYAEEDGHRGATGGRFARAAAADTQEARR